MNRVLNGASVTTHSSKDRRTRRRSFGLLAASILVIDQVTKHLVIARMTLGESKPLLGPILSLTYARNTGTAWGFLAGHTVLLAIIALVIVVAIALWGTRYAVRSPLLATGLASLLGGALGNMIDRMWLGHVTDFIDFHFWPIFNVADIAVVCGAILILIDTIFGGDCCACPPEESDD